MNAISGYLWRVICAAIVCALVGAIGFDGAGKGLQKLTAGLFLALAILSPLADVELHKLDLTGIRADARDAVRRGMEQATQEQHAIISDSLEAYIWNKAGELGLELDVSVALDGEGMPCSVELIGNASPLERQALGDVITRELGLGKEAQIWTKPHQSSE